MEIEREVEVWMIDDCGDAWRGIITHVTSYDRDMITRVTTARLLVVTLQFLD